MKQSRILTEMSENMQDLYDSGLVDEDRLKQFNMKYLHRVSDLTPVQIRQIRKKSKVSQSIFANIINVSASTVQKWESGEKHPSGLALRMLELIERRGLEIFIDNCTQRAM
jgi:putative transcriptional regulator